MKRKKMITKQEIVKKKYSYPWIEKFLGVKTVYIEFDNTQDFNDADNVADIMNMTSEEYVRLHVMCLNILHKNHATVFDEILIKVIFNVVIHYIIKFKEGKNNSFIHRNILVSAGTRMYQTHFNSETSDNTFLTIEKKTFSDVSENFSRNFTKGLLDKKYGDKDKTKKTLYDNKFYTRDGIIYRCIKTHTVHAYNKNFKMIMENFEIISDDEFLYKKMYDKDKPLEYLENEIFEEEENVQTVYNKDIYADLRKLLTKQEYLMFTYIFVNLYEVDYIIKLLKISKYTFSKKKKAMLEKIRTNLSIKDYIGFLEK